MIEKFNAIGYSRISSLDQSHNSIEDQNEAIKSFCVKNNLRLAKIFSENGKSAFTFNRPVWLELEKYIKENRNIGYLIIKHLDRFSRANLMDALVKLDEIENKLKVKVLTVSDPVNLDTSEFGVQIIRSIGLLFSNNERQRIRERTTDGIHRSLVNGRYCNLAPYGYTNAKDPDGKPMLVIDPQKADVVRFIFRKYLSGMSFEEVKTAAKEQGFNRNSRSAIQRILSTPTYAGLIEVPPYKGQPSRIVKGIHVPIVSEHDYYTALNKMNNKPSNAQRSEDVPLRGVVHCHICGRLLTAGNSKGSKGVWYWYYKCNTHKKNFPAKKMHKVFADILSHFSYDDATIQHFRERITEAIETKLSNKGGELMRTKLELEKVQKKIFNTQEKYLVQPDIDSAVYSKVITELKGEEARLQTKVGELNSTGKGLYDTMDLLLPKLKRIDELFLALPVHRQHLFVNIVFGYSLRFDGVSYTTNTLYPLFAHNEVILKEKGLLRLENNPLFGKPVTSSTEVGTIIQPAETDFLSQLAALLIA